MPYTATDPVLITASAMALASAVSCCSISCTLTVVSVYAVMSFTSHAPTLIHWGPLRAVIAGSSSWGFDVYTMV